LRNLRGIIVTNSVGEKCDPLHLESKGYRHKIFFLRGHKKSPSELLPRVYRVISLLKR
jgi:hypothetical protein